jgi:cytochrome c2
MTTVTKTEDKEKEESNIQGTTGLAILIVCAVLGGLAMVLFRREETRSLILTEVASGGNAEQGKGALEAYGCGSCHTIPGIEGATATVGPTLKDFAYQHYIAGQLTNTQENLVLFIQDPQTFEPGTVMPDLGVSETDARNMAAYIATLK